jgi:3-mercaptopropionate dioxygenase
MGMVLDRPITTLAPSYVIESIERAVRQDRVTALAEALTRLHRAGALEDDRWYLSPHLDRYSRKLVWSDPGERFAIIGMSWAPGQASPLHDHGGLWGAEIVVAGAMRETQYSLVERDADGRHRFRQTKNWLGFSGAISTLSPPLEYHAYGNAGKSIARTLHVYCGNPSTARRFVRESGDWYRGETVELRYDG